VGTVSVCLLSVIASLIIRIEQYYGGMSFKIAIHFPPNYPYVPPVIKFESPCFHPNVDIGSGAICLDILQDKWSAVYSVQTILLSLQSLLGGTELSFGNDSLPDPRS